MRIGIISDSHDHLPNLRHALTRMRESEVEAVIHCGDLIAPFVTLELGRFAGPVHTVFGNNDGDRFLSLRLAADKAPNVQHHGDAGLIELEGRRIAFSHNQGYAHGLALECEAQLALFGHTHLPHQERQGALLLVNPGELLGMKGAPAYCIYETRDHQVERITIDAQPWPSPQSWS